VRQHGFDEVRVKVSHLSEELKIIFRDGQRIRFLQHCLQALRGASKMAN